MDKPLIILNEVDSTNIYLMDLAAKKLVLPWTVVQAKYQTNGRGQRNNIWYSSKAKNLLCSILLVPTQLEAKDQFLLNIILSLAVFDTVDEIVDSGRTRIKWPNDIYVDDRKIAGLLLHNSLQGSAIIQSVLGVGLNVNEMDFPQHLYRATSISLISKKSHNLQSVLNRLILHLQVYNNELENGRFQYLRNLYQNRLFRLNEKCSFKDKEKKIFQGAIQGINEIGQLVIKTDKGISCFSLKDIAYIID